MQAMSKQVATVAAALLLAAAQGVKNYGLEMGETLHLVQDAAAVAARGRPTCQFCGNPIDAEGHACPAMNGHSKRD